MLDYWRKVCYTLLIEQITKTAEKGGFLLNNRDQFKKILNYLSALVIICAFTKCFDTVWNNFYNKAMRDPFWHNGNILMVAIYAVLYISMAKTFNGFRLGYDKFTGLFGSQVLGVLGANFIEFILVSLIGRGRLNIAPIPVMTVIQVAIAFAWSYVFTWIYQAVYPPRRMIIVYGNKNAKYLVSKMSVRNDKYRICASISCEESLEDIEREILKHEAVIISDIPNDLRNKLLKFTFENSIRTYINPKLSDIIVRGAEDFHLFDTPLLLARNDGLRWEQRAVKRILDIVLSAAALVVASPFMLVTAIAIYKFRSMIVDAEKKSGATLAKKNDSRITPIGKFIRKVRIDELPQLINILKGDMSFVGPRPERPEIAQKYEKTMPEFKYRLKVKAGLTGYAQVMGKYNTTPYDKLKLDLMYIEHQSLMLDLRIFFMTVKTCFIPEATEGVKDSAPLETHRDRVEHDNSKDEKNSEEIKL